ncbi:AEC family transporter [Thalassotalea sp. ND16A]|uniref:AEC family transporter n=1 Tax=Thalassotalea sp. ND16A TaxID=1535422 RepID=UPI00051A0E43|nr:AEC family transporter [Thalassotalea sp. ND16A]KGJ90287.1 hypothetical protein ND16A_2017 [Thalassotalea sp. ND16A]
MNILAIISPLIFVGLIGFITSKYDWFSKSQVDSLAKFTFNLSIPAFLFQQLANADLSNIDLSVYGAFYAPVLIVYCLAWCINYYFHQQHNHDQTASASYALGASYSNNVIVGLPVSLMVLGEEVLPVVFLVVSLHSALLFGITSFLSVKGKTFRWSIFFRQTLCNPLIIAISAGFMINLMAVTLPQILNDCLLLLGKPAITLALFLLGASLAYYRIRSEIKFIICASVLKLMVLPALVFISTRYIFEFNSLIITTLVILSASPTGVNAYLIVKQHEKHQQTVAGSIVVSTLISIVTIPVWLLLLP